MNIDKLILADICDISYTGFGSLMNIDKLIRFIHSLLTSDVLVL